MDDRGYQSHGPYPNRRTPLPGFMETSGLRELPLTLPWNPDPWIPIPSSSSPIQPLPDNVSMTAVYQDVTPAQQIAHSTPIPPRTINTRPTLRPLPLRPCYPDQPIIPRSKNADTHPSPEVPYTRPENGTTPASPTAHLPNGAAHQSTFALENYSFAIRRFLEDSSVRPQRALTSPSSRPNLV